MGKAASVFECDSRSSTVTHLELLISPTVSCCCAMGRMSDCGGTRLSNARVSARRVSLVSWALARCRVTSSRTEDDAQEAAITVTEE